MYGKSLISETQGEDVRLPVMMKSVMLPPVVEAKQVEAVFEAGVLRVFLPFKEKSELSARKIDIREL